MWSQVALRKHHYEQRQWRWWNSSWAISNPKRLFCESAALNMPANTETSTMAKGLEKVSFHSNPKERQCQRMYKYHKIALISHAVLPWWLRVLPAMPETWVQSLGWEDPLEKEMATQSSILAWRIPWTAEPGGLQSTGLQRIRHDWETSLSLYFTHY